MMWNALVSGLLLAQLVVLVDGDGAWPELSRQWDVAHETEPTLMGVSPAYLMACRKAGMQLPDLPSVRVLATAGSPLPAEGYDYVYEQLGPDVLLINGSGGTDVCSAIVSGGPMTPVYRGEISGRCLGVDTAAFDLDGRAVVGELGELVIRQPMPSMPVSFWGDADGARYRASYFDVYPGLWRQGDWVRFSAEGTCIITGRSDATLNRGGVRMGTSELYTVVEELPEVTDSLVVHLEDDEGGPGELVLFVVAELDDDLRGRIAGALRSQLSPRHVPDTIAAVPAIPRTLTGKKLEAPVKRILRGAPADSVASRGALAEPRAIDAFVQFSEGQEGGNDGCPARLWRRRGSSARWHPTAAAILRSEMPLEPYEASLGVLLRRWAAEAPDRVFLAERDGDGDWINLTWGEANRKAGAIAQALLDRGPGARSGRCCCCRATRSTTRC